MTAVSRTARPRFARRALQLLAIAPFLMVASAAHAQSAITVKPLSDDECTALAKELSNRSGVSVDMVVGSADSYLFTNVGGTACLFSGTATGISKNLENLSKIAGGFEGWTRDNAYDADGPDGTNAAFTRGQDWFAVSVSAEPPSGECEDVMISDCKAPKEKWTWTVSGIAFTAPASSVKPEF
ncbi:hypothetical protein [Amorphus sp. 3PC139-8]|uniref:hypothetical protein n=1 Tax=Amorphus sp. 3PC139-8 TaxID=2735676 RepID=UPI00345D91AB